MVSGQVRQLAIRQDACALLTTGEVWCRATFRRGGAWERKALDDIQELAGDGTSTVCVRDRAGQVTCFPFIDVPALMGLPDAPLERQIGVIADAVEMFVLRNTGCARRSTGRVTCWGLGQNGELGAVPSTVHLAPVEVPLPGPATRETGSPGFNPEASTPEREP